MGGGWRKPKSGKATYGLSYVPIEGKRKKKYYLKKDRGRRKTEENQKWSGRGTIDLHGGVSKGEKKPPAIPQASCTAHRSSSGAGRKEKEGDCRSTDPH